MEEYKPNSHKSKEEAQRPSPPGKNITNVISGTARTKKKSELRKFVGLFLPEDAESLKSHILMDVLIPAAKKAVSDGVDLILYGEAGRNRKNTGASKVSYRSYYDRRDDRRDRPPTWTRSGFDYDDVIFDTYGDAELVLSSMDEVISQYGVVSVLDFYDLSNVHTDNYAADKYGWTDLRSASVVRAREGYIVKLPKAQPLN